MIKMLIMDVDGTLTDGTIFMTENGEAIKVFHVQDGYGIKNILPKHGIKSALITGRESAITALRSAELDIDEVLQNQCDKSLALEQIAKKYNLSYEDMAYIGDDINDLPGINLCGLTACPADAVTAVKEKVDFVCQKKGGRGAVREFIDYIIISYNN